MTDLIDRIEAATGADRELFEEAFVAAFGPEPESKYDGRAWKRGEPDFAPEWTAYIERRCRYRQLIDVGAWLEAAMGLVPDDADWTLSKVAYEPCLVTIPSGDDRVDAVHGYAATPALALCAAALKARESEG